MAEQTNEEKLSEEKPQIDISSSIIEAYLINMGKAFLLVGILVGAVYLVSYFLGTNPFVDLFESIGIPLMWVQRIIIVCIGIYFVLVFFDTLSLTSYELIIDGDMLHYSYGSFFKVTKATQLSNILKVNFKQYSPLKAGSIMVDLTGTEEKNLKVRYVADAKSKCEQINDLINPALSTKPESETSVDSSAEETVAAPLETDDDRVKE